jgi:hypothetical protein
MGKCLSVRWLRIVAKTVERGDVFNVQTFLSSPKHKLLKTTDIAATLTALKLLFVPSRTKVNAFRRHLHGWCYISGYKRGRICVDS